MEMTVRDSHSISSSAHLSNKCYCKSYCHTFLFWFLFICLLRSVKQLIPIFFKYPVSLHIVLYLSNNFLSSTQKDIILLILSSTLNVLTYPPILGIIKTNGLISLSKYPTKYLKLVFLN